MNHIKTLLWGGRGKARILEYMLTHTGRDVSAIFDHTLEKARFPTKASFINVPRELPELAYDCTHYVVCIGGAHGYARTMTSEFLEQEFSLKPLSVIDDAAHVSETVSLGSGVQIMPGAIVHHFTEIGDFTILNTKAHVDHECVIGRGVHVMGGASLAGEIIIEDFATIGTNATILPSKKIGEGAYVGAGCVVVDDVEPYTVVVGNPMRTLKENKLSLDRDVFVEIHDATVSKSA